MKQHDHSEKLAQLTLAQKQKLKALIEQKKRSNNSHLSTLKGPLSPFQHSLWTVDQINGSSTEYNIVGAIANEADLKSEYIGHIEIYDRTATVDLPAGMPEETMGMLRRVVICGQRLNIKPASEVDLSQHERRGNGPRRGGRDGNRDGGRPHRGKRPPRQHRKGGNE